MGQPSAERAEPERLRRSVVPSFRAPRRPRANAVSSRRSLDCNLMRCSLISRSSPLLLSRGVAFLLPCLVALSVPVSAQCSTQWVGSGVPVTNGRVLATTMWDPDGAGPMQPVLVVGGEFTSLGNRIAAHDPVSGAWSGLGSGMNGAVYALTTLPSGDLVAAGMFTTAGGVSANYI